MWNILSAFAVTLQALVVLPVARVRQWQLTAMVRSIPATFMSSDEVERAEAFEFGYRNVCQHPREIGALDAIKLLVLDCNQILFDDYEQAIAIANEAARRGIIVGIHTYHPESPKLHGLTKVPNVLVAKTHRHLLHDIGRYAKLHARPRQKIETGVKPLKGTGDQIGDYAHWYELHDGA